MNDSIDPNKVAAEALTALVTQAFTNVTSKASTIAKNSWTKVFEDFSPFMKECFQKNSRVRLLSQKDSDVELYSVYVKSHSDAGKMYMM